MKFNNLAHTLYRIRKAVDSNPEKFGIKIIREPEEDDESKFANFKVTRFPKDETEYRIDQYKRLRFIKFRKTNDGNFDDLRRMEELKYRSVKFDDLSDTEKRMLKYLNEM